MSFSIIVLDDDAAYCSKISEYLSLNGHAVKASQEPERVETMLATEKPDLLIIDQYLGTTTGTAILRRIRAYSDIPCIIVTGYPDSMNRIVNLELGADDEIDKKVSPRELLARINSVLRRNQTAIVPRFSYARPNHNGTTGSWRFEEAKRVLLRPDGTVCHLTSAEFETLRTLSKATGTPVSRHELCEKVFQRKFITSDRAIDTVIAKIREKIRTANGPDVIKTVRHSGYVFVGFEKDNVD
jgi:DNA-binding response OmpR family regulator